MTQQPSITLSSLDLDRLEHLLDSLPREALANHRQLLAELERANVVEPSQVPPTLVTMNSRVRFRVEPEGREFQRTLVYPSGMDGDEEKISVLAPIGSALLGLSVGDSIAWPTPKGGEMNVRIMEILYQPEAAGEMHR
ncbi:GreA/GreB family elongation factor [Thioalkalivibrio sulfidiphilus HL-EbGr7]|uniref:GreA/GreB family elongation factor n=1 Tax=Thioalkalivibrio sulfidiphilus (strain HL-EbGR7) TaxID=396588 RepID=B8GS58_THISH|nr:nucleoside diphosphate kinase regulator [Thioalkalivibrio sulfidiphilus]ACL72762.1 GreA/GreB family elongation factor [Thioalkalivibrio sulfidiphilus HL-EbGr7]